MENDLPKIDLPEDWVVGTDISKELLSLYANYPCRLKAEIFVLCMSGELEVSMNLDRFWVKPYSFVSILPGSIFQIHQLLGELKIYFMGFSSAFMEQTNPSKSAMDLFYKMRDIPVIILEEPAARMVEDYFCLLIKGYEQHNEQISREMLQHLQAGMLLCLGNMYKDKVSNKTLLSKAEQTSKDFGQLVMQHYAYERSIAWYAKRLGITSGHLSSVVKMVTGKTCNEIITVMVVMDAKTQLRTTELAIQDIADSLHFPNVSFFGKYFKRSVGVSPLEYRNTK